MTDASQADTFRFHDRRHGAIRNTGTGERCNLTFGLDHDIRQEFERIARARKLPPGTLGRRIITALVAHPELVDKLITGQI